MKPGDLVSLSEGRMLHPHAPAGGEWFTVGSLITGESGFRVPSGSIALVLSLEARPTHSNPEYCHVHVLVDGRLGWVYPEDGEVINT